MVSGRRVHGRSSALGPGTKLLKHISHVPPFNLQEHWSSERSSDWPRAQSREVCWIPKPALSTTDHLLPLTKPDPGDHLGFCKKCPKHPAFPQTQECTRCSIPGCPAPHNSTPVVHKDHSKNVLVGLGNGDWLSEFVPRAYKESLTWES